MFFTPWHAPISSPLLLELSSSSSTKSPGSGTVLKSYFSVQKSGGQRKSYRNESREFPATQCRYSLQTRWPGPFSFKYEISPQPRQTVRKQL
jgi:hypothetical protein